MTTGRHLVCENLNIKIHCEGKLSFIFPSIKSIFKINMFSSERSSLELRDEFLIRAIVYKDYEFKSVVKIKTLIVHNYSILINNIFFITDN